MAENDPVLISQILYYIREGYFNTASGKIINGLKSYINDNVLKYYYSLTLMLQDRNHEAVRELESLRNREDVALGSMIALVYAHKKFQSQDREAIVELETRIKEMRKKADEKSLYYAGFFWYSVKRPDKAKEYIDRGLKQNDSFCENLCVRGWIEILTDPKKALIYFEKSLSVNSKFFDAMLGTSKGKELLNQFSQALDCVNRILVNNPNLVGIVVEKMKLQLCSQDWDQCNEVSLRALSLDNECLEAFRYQILELLCRDGRYADAADGISNLLRKIEKNEPSSHGLYYDYSKVFARVCGRSGIVLKETEKYLEKAIQLDSENVDYLNELGAQKIAQEKYKDAIKCYNIVLKKDTENITAILGRLKCQMNEDNLEDVGQQLEFLAEALQAVNVHPEFPYLKAIYNKKTNNSDKNVKLIDESITTHFKALKGLPLGKSYFYNLNPDFVLELVKEYMAFAPSSPLEDGQPINSILKKCGAILEPLTKAVPGLIQGIFYLAKVKYISGEVDSAKVNLQRILDKDPSYSEAHILMAQIHLRNNDFKSANQSLEYGLSYNFTIKNQPTYHLIKARIYKQQGNYQEALKTLSLAMQLPGVKQQSKTQVEISIQDRASVYLELSEMYLMNKLQHEATKIIQDALNEFKGTSEETRISVANVDLLLSRGDVDNALNILKKIESSQPYYVEAREKMAKIYLNNRKDRRLYIATYKELAEKFQNPNTLNLLGDAYMNIIEPEKAVEVYETAMAKNPKDSVLAKKIGQALIKSHQYTKAISYYTAALKSGHQHLLRYDLAELYNKLNQLDSAEKIISEALSEINADPEYLGMVAKCYILAYDINFKRNRSDSLLTSLEKAKEFQLKAIKRAQVDNPDLLEELKKNLSAIYKKFFEHHSESKDYNAAEKALKEAILQDESDREAQLMLANHYLKTENLETCAQLCNHMLKSTSNPDVEILAILANLNFKKDDIDQGIAKFTELFEKKRDHYDGLCTLIRFLYRAGKIDDAKEFFEKIDKDLPKAPTEPGYNYAMGLYYQLSSKPTEALKYYNKCRGDKMYGRLASIEMADLCLNPENEIRSDEDWRKKNLSQKQDSSKIAKETAIKLLQIAQDKPNDLKFRIMENYCHMHTNDKASLEKALENFAQLENIHKDHPSVLRGIAECYMLLKQVPKARNYLKRASTIPWNSDDADDLEKCWLLLASTYMANGKYDQALEFCKKCLEYNKSCTKAYEFTGMIMEREAAYKDASENYFKAWIYGNKNQPNVGYKLAFNYLKDKKYIEAIDISHYVIEKFPDFPKIRKDILEKARQSYRT
ncbi:unnamed protein product [Brachionus calyciflorus]|uniref:Tetratricopeptide repeat protein 21B n=1 Tax=Brachionus calyciflorus TaxID=104777 RepID=A0A813QCN1_9BILA|nr:unnamed protein product [Brachionus calyciflorus]